MAAAMSKMNNIMDVPEECVLSETSSLSHTFFCRPKYTGPRLAPLLPEERSAKKDLIKAAQEVQGALSGLNDTLDA